MVLDRILKFYKTIYFAKYNFLVSKWSLHFNREKMFASLSRRGIVQAHRLVGLYSLWQGNQEKGENVGIYEMIGNNVRYCLYNLKGSKYMFNLKLTGEITPSLRKHVFVRNGKNG